MRINARNKKLEARQLKLQKLSQHVRSNAANTNNGWYVFENTNNGDYFLPRPLPNGRNVIVPAGQFEGDGYYLGFVGKGLRLISTITERKTMEEQKLLLDQPATVTTRGTVEHVVAKPQEKLNEGTPQDKPKDVLLNEDPMDGVKIIM